MTKKFIYFVLLSSLIIGGLGGWLFTRFIIPKINAIPVLARYNLTPSSAPLIINRREEIRVNEGSDTVAAIQTVRPWVVGVTSGDSAHPQISGAGIVLTSDGIIAVTKTLVGAGSTVNVLLQDGRILPASVVAQDPASEIVLVKVNANNLPVADLGSAKDLQLGQRMIVIQPTLSDSHFISNVSYLSSEVQNSTEKIFSSEQLSQTFKIDGQPVPFEGAVALSTDGKIRGIYSKNQIITADTLRSAWENFSKNGVIKRAYLGFYYQPISKALAVQLKLQEGILVRKPASGAAAVIAGSPAQQAGLQENDLIIQANGAAVNLDNSFEDLVTRLNSGDTLNLRVLRAGNQISLTLKVATK